MIVKTNAFVALLLLFTFWSVQAIEIEWYYERGGGRWAFDCDISGIDMGSVNVASRDCGQYCYNTPGCTRWTWSGSSKKCILKRGNEEPYYFKHGGTCGVI